MSRSTGRVLLILGLVAAAALVFRALEEGRQEGGFELEDGAAPGTPETGPAPRAETSPPPTGPGKTAARDGVPRVLPPDAAIEDVRDALAQKGAARTRDVQAAYAAIARIANEGYEILRGLQRYVSDVEDPVVRGIVLAALGANRDPRNLTWLASRLRFGVSSAERVGAFLGLAYGSSDVKATCNALGGITHPVGPLPTSRTVLESVAGWVDRETSASAADGIVALLFSVERDVDVAALLVVDGTRPCKLYTDLSSATRTVLRAAALKHKALPGAVRRVLTNAK